MRLCILCMYHLSSSAMLEFEWFIGKIMTSIQNTQIWFLHWISIFFLLPIQDLFLEILHLPKTRYKKKVNTGLVYICKVNSACNHRFAQPVLNWWLHHSTPFASVFYIWIKELVLIFKGNSTVYCGIQDKSQIPQ